MDTERLWLTVAAVPEIHEIRFTAFFSSLFSNERDKKSRKFTQMYQLASRGKDLPSEGWVGVRGKEGPDLVLEERASAWDLSATGPPGS